MTGITIKDTLRESRLFSVRLWAVSAVLVVLAALLLGRLVWLQVIDHRHYATLSQANRIKAVPIPPPRGYIFDRNGVILAQNFPVLALEVTPDQAGNLNDTLAALGEIVSLNERDLRNFHRQRRSRPRFEAIALRTHLSDEEAANFAVHRHRFPGVDLRAFLQRHYPHGGLAVHALGYVGRISDADLERIDKAAYFGSQYIGKLGVEQAYEDELLGEVGTEKIEVNAHGRAVRVLERKAPKAGENLYLALDSRLQRLAEEALGARKGAVVALDPASGAVLAFASTPTYDPNLFVNGIDVESYRKLSENTAKPLVNRALNGRSAPGSTVKAFFGLTALESGIDPQRTVNCPGWYSLPGDTHRFRCWRREGHGAMNLHDAVVQSCDVYFYSLAVNLGVDRLQQALAGFGFGAPTGIDLGGESSGLLPSPARRKARKQPWYPGETVVSGIGQGPTLVTPLQLAAGAAALANRGARVRPHLVESLMNPETRAVRSLDIAQPEPVPLTDPTHIEIEIANLTDVVHGEGGTARGIGWNAPYRIAGKTGTAQVKGIAQGETYDEKNVPEEFRDHALFIAFAPVEQPTIAVAVVVENGGHGGSTAAPIARKIMDYAVLGKDRPLIRIPASQVEE